MNEVIYRDIQREDFEKIRELVEETWRFEERISDVRTRHRFVQAMLSATLLTSSWGQVALLDERLVGFILGSVRKEKRRLRSVAHAGGLVRDILTLLLAKKSDKQGIREYLNVPRAYQSMKKGRTFPAEITFLAVSHSCQGLGIGKRLTCSLMHHVQSMNVEFLLVFTDSQSSYQFYDHLGFSLQDKRDIPLKSTRQSDSHTIFLYGYRFLSTGLAASRAGSDDGLDPGATENTLKPAAHPGEEQAFHQIRASCSLSPMHKGC